MVGVVVVVVVVVVVDELDEGAGGSVAPYLIAPSPIIRPCPSPSIIAASALASSARCFASSRFCFRCLRPRSKPSRERSKS